jgi:signal transduction histidine kinase/ligand-binding sensor domain-containing protein
LWAFQGIAIPQTAHAQPFTFRRIGTEQGLSQCTVLSMLQDRYGFMWFCSQDGLNRYDGYTFKVYKHGADDSTSLSSSLTITVYEDHNGTLWVGTYNGLNRLNRATGAFQRFYPDSLRIPQRCSIWNIWEIPDGRLVVATSNGLYQLDRQQQSSGDGQPQRLREFVSADGSAAVFRGKVCQRIPDYLGRYLVRVERQLFELNTFENRFTRIAFTPASINPYRNMLTPVYVSADGAYWSITEASVDSSLIGLYRFKPASDPIGRASADYTTEQRPEEWTRFAPRSNGSNAIQTATDMVGKLYQDHQHRVWVQTLDGLHLFDPVQNRFHSFRHNPADPLSLGANRIVSMYEDRSKLLWIASNGSGVNILLPQKFSLYRLADAPAARHEAHLHYANRDSHTGGRFHFLKGIAEDRDGALWIAEYDHGLRRFDRASGAFTEYKDMHAPLGSSMNSLLCLHLDADGLIWFGGSFNRLGCFDPRTKKFRYFENRSVKPFTGDVLWINYMRFLTEDGRGNLWLATDHNGLHVFNKRMKRYVAHFLNNLDVSSVMISRSGVVYAGTDGAGVFTFTPEGGTTMRSNSPNTSIDEALPRFNVKHFMHQPTHPKSLSANNSVKYFYEDQQGLVWVAMDGGGLNCFDPRTQDFTRFAERDGLPNSVVYGILPDERGNLWLSTNKGLSKFNPARRTFRNYDVSDGLQANEFNTNAFCKLRSGELLFGGIGGINIFHPDSVRDNPNAPSVRLTELLINDKAQLFGKPLEDLHELTLRYDQNTLAFTFAALDYTNSAKNRYMYKLEGVTHVIDKDWVQSGTGRTVRYAALPQGEYVFRVKACNNDGVWNENGLTLRIRLVPPFWRTGWFYTFCVVVSLAGGAGFVRSVVRRRLLQRIERLEHERALERANLERALAIERERGRIAQDIHDEVGPGVTKILLLSGFADTVATNGSANVSTNGSAAGAEANNGVSALARAAQEVIDGMNGIIWMTNPKNDTLDNLVAYIREYAAEYLDKAGIVCRFDIPDTVPPIHLYGTLRRNLFLTMKEALNNIVKHAHATEVMITLLLESREHFQFHITDNGRGMTQSPTSRFGNGLDNMRQRMDECGCRFDIVTGDGRGTSIVLDVLTALESMNTPHHEGAG